MEQNNASSLPQERQVCEKRDIKFALIFLVFSILAVNFFLWGGTGVAASAAAIGLFFASVLYLLPHRSKFTPYCIVCMVLYVLCAMSFFFSDDRLSKLYCTVALIVLFNLTLIELRDLRRWPSGTFRSIEDWFTVTFANTLTSLSPAIFALFHRKGNDGALEKRRIGSVLLGIICAIPALIVIVPLLLNADAAFQALMERLTFDRISEILVSVLMGIALFLAIFSQHFTAKTATVEPETQEQDSKGLDTIIINTFFAVITAVYLLYLFSQLAYFFSAFSGLLPKEYTVAEYARRGFFEMVTVCMINLGFVIAAQFLASKKNDKQPLSVRLFSLFLCIFSCILIATAMSKMLLYIGSFGMTHKRILTSVFMVFLAVAFITMAIRLFCRKFPFLKICLIAAVVLVTALGFADVDRIIAKHNVEAYLSGSLDSVDMDELSALSSDGIVPYVLALTNDANKAISESAYEILFNRLLSHNMILWDSEDPKVVSASYDWRRYNFSEHEAFTLLQEHAEEITEGYQSAFK